MEIKPEYRSVFSEEAREYLEEWEQALLALERHPEDRELVNQLFRSIHTLKGSAGFIGFDQLQKLAHDLESALQEIRDGVGIPTPRILEVLFRGLDLAGQMVTAFSAGQPYAGDVEGFLAELWELQGKAVDPEQPPAEVQRPAQPVTGGSPPASQGEIQRFEVLILATGGEGFLRAFLLRQRLASVGRIVSEEPSPEYLRNAPGSFAYVLSLEARASPEQVRKAFDIDLVEVKELGTDSAQGADAARGTGVAQPGAVDEARRLAHTEEVVRVSVDKLDSLLNLVGELVIQNSGFVSISQRLKDLPGRNALVAELEEKTENLAKITRDLQDSIMKVRMLPVSNVFNRFHRVVRDLAKDSGKEISLEVFGEETEIDKKVMDRIGEPLVHLVRNSVDHGIEERGERLAAGKSPVGRIRLGAFQDGDHICLEVSDDGRGLDKPLILKKAVEKGMFSQAEAERLPDEQVLGLIFLPGFSTAQKVTDLSGRGVGMDVVKRAIEGMGGSLRVRSFASRGTTVTISLPLTMAIIPAVLAEAEQSVFAIPLSAVKEILKVEERNLRSVGKRKVIQLREAVLSMVHLREALGLNGNGVGHHAEGRTPVVILEYEDKRIGLGVDRIIGTGEIVIKSLSRHYREIEGLIGASILGNGQIALIVDVETMIRRHYRLDESGGPAEGGSIFVSESREAQAAQPEQPVQSVQAVQPVQSVQPEESQALPPAQAPAAAAEPQAESGEVQLLYQALQRTIERQLSEIHSEWAIQASLALSQLTGQEMRVSFPEARLVPLGDVAEQLGGEECPVGGLYMGLSARLSGAVLVIMPKPKLLLLHDLLYRREAGSCRDLGEVDWSGISELGNILSAAFLNALGNATGLVLKAEAPEITVDMCLPVIDSVLARFNQPGEQILMTDAVITSGRSQEVVCHLLLVFELDSLALLKQVLESSPS